MKLLPYTDDLISQGKSEPSFMYLMDSFLQSRINTGQESNGDYFDEDVNVYLVLLLNSLVSNHFNSSSGDYIVHYDSDLRERLDRTESDFTKYDIYRANADFLLLQTGMFRIPTANDPDIPLLDSIERGSTYYRFACSLTDRIPERYRSLSEVLGKLAYDFEKYRRILSFMRGEFLSLVEPINEFQVGLIYSDMNDIERAGRIQECNDSLLDAYLEFLKHGTDPNRARVEKKLAELKELDPNAWPGFVTESENYDRKVELIQ